MTGGGPLPVREYASAEEMRAHVKAVRDRLFGSTQPRLVTLPVARKAVAKPASVVPAPPEVLPPPIPADPALTRTAYLAAMRVLAPNRHKVRSIIRVVCVVSGVDHEALVRPGRAGKSCKARQIAMFLACRCTGLSLQQIGQHFAGRDHSTVFRACRRCEVAIAACGIPDSTDVVDLAQGLWDATWPAWGGR